MDFVDLDKVLDEFEEEEKQALSIVPGQELKPSGYLEFIQKHQEQDWALINPTRFSSTSGYTLERRSAREPANVAYDDPYDSFSTYKLGFMANNQRIGVPQNKCDSLPGGKARRSKSAIVTSLTRISAHDDDDVNAVYSNTAAYQERKGIANCSERKGTIACHATEVQTDALSLASEHGLLSSPYPQSDINIDGHCDTNFVPREPPTMPGELAYCNESNQSRSPVYAERVPGDITYNRETNTQASSNFAGILMKQHQTPHTVPGISSVRIAPISNSSSHFNLHSSPEISWEEGTSTRVTPILSPATQHNHQLAADNPHETDIFIRPSDQAVGFPTLSDADLDECMINTYLRELDELRTQNADTLQYSNSSSVYSQDTTEHVANRENEALGEEQNMPKVDNFLTSQIKSWQEESRNSRVMSASSDGGSYCQDSGVVSDFGLYSQSEAVTKQFDNFRLWSNVSYGGASGGVLLAESENESCYRNSFYNEPTDRTRSYNEPTDRTRSYNEPTDRTMSYNEHTDRTRSYNEPTDRTMSYNEPTDRTRSYNEPTDRTRSYNEPSDRIMSYNEPSDRDLSHFEPPDKSSVDPIDGHTMYNGLTEGKMEIVAMLDGMDQAESAACQWVPRHREAEDALDDDIIDKQQLMLETYNLSAQSSENLDLLGSSCCQSSSTHPSDATERKPVQTSFSDSDSNFAHLTENLDHANFSHMQSILTHPSDSMERKAKEQFLSNSDSNFAWCPENVDHVSSSHFQHDSNPPREITENKPNHPFSLESDSNSVCPEHSSSYETSGAEVSSTVVEYQPRSLLSISRCSLDLWTVVTPDASSRTENNSTHNQTLDSNVLHPSSAYSEAASRSFPLDSSSLDSETLSDAASKLDSASLQELTSKPLDASSQSFSQIQSDEKNNQLLVDTDGLNEPQLSGVQKMKRPTSLNLPVKLEAAVGNADEEDVLHEDSTAQCGSGEVNEEDPADIQQQSDYVYTSVPLHCQATHGSLGLVAPFWIPDAEAQSCMNCQIRFTIWKRRHHCRACGKVLCAGCCNQKAVLHYMENKEARVCVECHIQLILVPNLVPNPYSRNPDEYCSKVAPSQQTSIQVNPPVASVPSGVLKTSGSQKQFSEPKQVMFSDGIRPGSDLTDLESPEESPQLQDLPRTVHKQQSSQQMTKLKEDSLSRSQSLIPADGLPPVVATEAENGFYGETAETVNWADYLISCKSEEGPLITYAINRNLYVGVKIINLDCCMNRICWCCVTQGMDTAGQSELVVLLELTEEELMDPALSPPKEIFLQFQAIYCEALKGNIIQEMGHFAFQHSSEFRNPDDGGLLFLQPTFQCLMKVPLTGGPFLFGVVIKKQEIPWARLFPVRLMLRLGAECRYYPCSLVSLADRKPVFHQIGHTIINLLADFHNYLYTLPQIRGVTVFMENKKTVICLPQNGYDEVMKALRSSNEHVMALGSSFNSEVDSHLVCIQSEDGNYQTQSINIQNKPRLVTGVSFVVFNGALKSSSGMQAKSSIVEDGLMVQVLPEVLAGIKDAIKTREDYVIQCGPVDADTNDGTVELRWADDTANRNAGVKSYIDSAPLDRAEMISNKCLSDYRGEHLAVRWTRVYFLEHQDLQYSDLCSPDMGQLVERIAHACCTALVNHLDELKQEGQVRLGLRVDLTRESIGYEIGSKGQFLPVTMLNNLDTFLIPVIHQSSNKGVILELTFHIVE